MRLEHHLEATRVSGMPTIRRPSGEYDGNEPVRTSLNCGSGLNTLRTGGDIFSTNRWKTICFPSGLQCTPVKMPTGPVLPSVKRIPSD